MKYKLIIQYEFITEEQENYNEFIEDGYSPKEAKKIITDNLYALADKISCRADNTFYGPYHELIKVEELNPCS